MVFWEKQRSIILLYEKMSKPICEKYGLTQMEYDIIMFFHNNPQFETAADIVRMRKLTKSHVSMSIAALERKGLLLKQQSEKNKKSTSLKFTDSTDVIVSDGVEMQECFGRLLLGGLTDGEKETCRNIFLRLCDNANKALSEK